MRQIELLTRDLAHNCGRALKYYTAYNELMQHFDSIPDCEKKKVDKKLKQAGL